MRRLLLTSAFLCLLPLLSFGQSAPGRVGFGFNMQANKYYGEFTDNRFWFAGDLFVRWNVLDFLSLHGAVNIGQLRIKVNEQNIRGYPEYFGPWDQPTGSGVGAGLYPDGNGGFTGIRRTEFNLVRHTGFQGLMSLNLWPIQKFVPFVIGGVELLNFEPRNSEQQNVALPNNARGAYDKSVLGSVFGLGFESYFTPDLALNGKGLYHYTGTSWLDDYSDGSVDRFLTFGVGLTYYIFGYTDSDEDGLTDGDELNVYKTDPHNADTDGDGLRDGDEVKVHRTEPTQPDTDGDGLTDGDEVLTQKTNPLAEDSDADGLKDGEELKAYKTNPLQADTDGDGLPDGEEVLTYKTLPTNPDTDQDGLADGDEVRRLNTSPTNADTDADGLSDGDEVNTHKTNPTKADTDGDSLADGDELNQYKTNPLVTDSDGDKLSDGDEVNIYKTSPSMADTDGDGLDDGEEVLNTHTNPLKPDTDGDGIDDKTDRCPLIAGVAPDGCPPKPPVNTVTNFPGVLFIVNTDKLDMTVPGTLENLQNIRGLVEQCKDLRVEIEGHASGEGKADRNQELSELRALMVKNWLIEQGVSAEKIVRTVGYGSSKPIVPEPEPGKVVKDKKGKVISKGGATPEQIEAARKQNRRIAVKVVETCK